MRNGTNTIACLVTTQGVGCKNCPFVQKKSYFDEIQWHHFALETAMARNGRPLKKLTLVYNTMMSNEFIEYLQPKLQDCQAQFRCLMGRYTFQTSIESLLTNIMVFVIDFAKNYNFEVQNEMQSMHLHTY
jgi:hypothetical protein